jgi:hypothetical protein
MVKNKMRRTPLAAMTFPMAGEVEVAFVPVFGLVVDLTVVVVGLTVVVAVEVVVVVVVAVAGLPDKSQQTLFDVGALFHEIVEKRFKFVIFMAGIPLFC